MHCSAFGKGSNSSRLQQLADCAAAIIANALAMGEKWAHATASLVNPKPNRLLAGGGPKPNRLLAGGGGLLAGGGGVGEQGTAGNLKPFYAADDPAWIGGG